MYPIRAALEEVAAREAARRLGGDVTALERERDAIARARRMREQVEHDARFHRLIVAAAGNGRLLELWESLQVEARTAITALRVGMDPAEVAALHDPILDALRRQDAAAAGREIRRHVEDFGRRFIEARAESS
jgi:DNA-binding GntR family transcriptional regulator